MSPPRWRSSLGAFSKRWSPRMFPPRWRCSLTPPTQLPKWRCLPTQLPKRWCPPTELPKRRCPPTEHLKRRCPPTELLKRRCPPTLLPLQPGSPRSPLRSGSPWIQPRPGTSGCLCLQALFHFMGLAPPSLPQLCPLSAVPLIGC